MVPNHGVIQYVGRSWEKAREALLLNEKLVFYPRFRTFGYLINASSVIGVKVPVSTIAPAFADDFLNNMGCLLAFQHVLISG